MPGLNPIEAYYKHLKCIFYTGWTCYDIYGNFTNSTRNDTMPLHIGVGNRLNTGHSSLPSLIAPDIASATVLFTFGHYGREDKLAETLLSFDTNYAAAFDTSFVVFYNKDAPLNFKFLSARLKSFPASSINKNSRQIVDRIKFVPVKLKVVPIVLGTLDYDCSTDNPEIIGASHFLRFEAFDILFSTYGYTWFWRFADDSTLKTAITYNVFESLVNTNKRYGYVLIFREQKKCVDYAWSFVNHVCKSEQSKNFKCSDWLEKWPSYVAFFNNFEISHISLWQSDTVQRVRKLITGDDGSVDVVDGVVRRSGGRRKSQSSTGTSTSISLSSTTSTATAVKPGESGLGVTAFDLISDSSIHTLCVLITLLPEDVVRLDQIDYTAHLPPQSFTRLNQNAFGGSSSSKNKRVILDRRHHYNSMTRDDLEKKFQVRRHGWMGGDVAASFYLPFSDELNNAVHTQNRRRYVWLFGDTLVGTSSTTM